MKNNYKGWKVPVQNYQIPAIDLSEDHWPWNARTDGVSGGSNSKSGANVSQAHNSNQCLNGSNDRYSTTAITTKGSPLTVKQRQELIQRHVYDNYIQARKPALLRASKQIFWLNDEENNSNNGNCDASKSNNDDDDMTKNNNDKIKKKFDNNHKGNTQIIIKHNNIESPLIRLLNMPMLQKWSSPNFSTHLAQLAGSINVNVEIRSSSHESFGKGLLKSMTFQHFLDRVTRDNDEGLYLTASSTSTTMEDDNSGHCAGNGEDKQQNSIGRVEKRKQSELDKESDLQRPSKMVNDSGGSRQKQNSSEEKSNSQSSNQHSNQQHQQRDGNNKSKAEKGQRFLSPLAHALHDNGKQFPLRPFIMGNLIPSSIHAWMGRSSSTTATTIDNNNTSSKNSYSSSGLHHDYHDNLYVLLRGTKRFRLFAPSDAEYMYLHGTVSQVHENGLINHCIDDNADEGGPTTSDGIPVSLFKEYVKNIQQKQKRQQKRELTQRKIEIEQRLAEAEEDVDNGVAGAEKRLDEVEAELEEVIDLWIDMDGEDNGVGNSLGNNQVDNRSKHNSSRQSDINNSHGDSKHSTKQLDPTAKITYPKSFSRIPPSLLPSDKLHSSYDSSSENDSITELFNQYPLFQHAKAAYCHLMAGDALYLPASWFHEVSSSSRSTELQQQSDAGAHLALNYWFHPPSNVDNFDAPYNTDFWPGRWEKKVFE